MTQTSAKIKLHKVFCHRWYTADYDGVVEIYLIADGKGPMGFYDRVHVINLDESHLIFPAHNCDKMELKK